VISTSHIVHFFLENGEFSGHLRAAQMYLELGQSMRAYGISAYFTLLKPAVGRI